MIELAFSLPAYRMVLINVCILVMTLAGYYLVSRWSKKAINPIIILLLFATMPLISIFRSGSYESGDLSINAIKTIAFADAQKEGYLLPQWAKNLNATYGYPNFIFAYPLPYYFTSFFYRLIGSSLIAVKLFLILAFLCSGLAFYFWQREEVSEPAALIGALFYLFAPYHLINLHFRVAIGELAAMVFIPLSAFYLKRWSRNLNLRYGMLSALSLALLILSHQALSLAAFPLLFLYAVSITTHQQKHCRILLPSLLFVLALSLSAFYWLPAVIEGIYTHQASFAQTLQFIELRELFISPYRFGFLFQGPQGELTFTLGWIHWLVIFISIILIIKSKRDLSQLIFWLTATGIYLFLLLPLSQPLWEIIPLLKNFQFTYRLLAILTLTTSVLASSSAQRLLPKYRNAVFIAVALMLATTILNWGNRKNLPGITEAFLQQHLPYSTALGEGLGPAAPKWTNPQHPWMDTPPPAPLEVLSGQANVTLLQRKAHSHRYQLKVAQKSLIKENTLFFPGWELFLNQKPYPVDYRNYSYPGVITITLEPGEYILELAFQPTPIRIVSRIISALSFLALLTALIYPNVRLKSLQKFPRAKAKRGGQVYR